LIGAGGWLGSLALLTLVAVPAARNTDVGDSRGTDLRIASLVRAFSPTALVFASVLGLTGVVIAWGNLGSVVALWQSEYGRVLALKISLLVVVAGTGAYNWRLVLPTLGNAESSAALRRSSLVELCVGLLVLVATSVLVATPLPGE
jgi:putative copper export protein